MGKFTFPTRLLLLAILAAGLSGCELNRPEGQPADIDQFSAPTAIAPTAAVAQTDVTIRLDPATRQLNVGETATIQIRLENVTNMSEVDLQLEFAPDLLQVQDFDPGAEGVQIQPGDFFSRDFVEENQADNDQGTINYYAVPQPISGNGLLATINFRAVASGVSDLNFTRADIYTSEGEIISLLPQPGQVIVNEGAGLPTSTLAPDQPTPTLTLIPGLVTATFTPVPITVVPTSTPTPTNTPLPTPTNTPAPPAVQIPPGATVGVCYRVQPGETLYSLGQKFGIDPGFINLANDLYPPGHIYPQKILFVPTQYGSGPNVYMVQPNDTLALIAEQCQLDIDVLAYVNNLDPTANLEDITTLIIPRPPFAPPSRYPYPQVGPPSVWPPPCSGPC
jgi:LysM repeat protein